MFFAASSAFMLARAAGENARPEKFLVLGTVGKSQCRFVHRETDVDVIVVAACIELDPAMADVDGIETVDDVTV